MIKNPQLAQQMFSGPVPGQSLTHAPKSMPYEKPPQFVKLEDALNMLTHQITEPENLKQLLGLMEMGMSIEAICRTLLFSGFANGYWTPDLAMLMYKPLMLLLITMAHKAGLSDTPVVMDQSLHKHIYNSMRTRVMSKKLQGEPVGMPKPPKAAAVELPLMPIGKGFAVKGAA